MKKIFCLIAIMAMLCMSLGAVTRSNGHEPPPPPPPPPHHGGPHGSHGHHAPPPPPREFTISIHCDERNASVFIDDNYVGEANRTYTVRPGRHDVKVKKDGFYDFKTTVDCDRNRDVNVDLKRLPPPPPPHHGGPHGHNPPPPHHRGR